MDSIVINGGNSARNGLNIMKQASLYQRYLALDAVTKAIKKSGTKISGSGAVEIRPESYRSANLVADRVIQESGIQRARLFDMGIYGVMDADISAYLDSWHGSGPDLYRGRGAVLRSLKLSLPESGVLIDEEGSHSLLGRVHGVTFVLRVGVLPGWEK